MLECYKFIDTAFYNRLVDEWERRGLLFRRDRGTIASHDGRSRNASLCDIDDTFGPRIVELIEALLVPATQEEAAEHLESKPCAEGLSPREVKAKLQDYMTRVREVRAPGLTSDKDLAFKMYSMLQNYSGVKEGVQFALSKRNSKDPEQVYSQSMKILNEVIDSKIFIERHFPAVLQTKVTADPRKETNREKRRREEAKKQEEKAATAAAATGQGPSTQRAGGDGKTGKQGGAEKGGKPSGQKGPKGGCHGCGGPHYLSDCTEGWALSPDGKHAVKGAEKKSVGRAATAGGGSMAKPPPSIFPATVGRAELDIHWDNGSCRSGVPQRLFKEWEEDGQWIQSLKKPIEVEMLSGTVQLRRFCRRAVKLELDFLPGKALMFELDFFELPAGSTVAILGRFDMFSVGLLDVLGKVQQAWPAHWDQYSKCAVTSAPCEHMKRAAVVEHGGEPYVQPSFPFDSDKKMDGAEEVKKVKISNDPHGVLRAVVDAFPDVFASDMSKPSLLRPPILKIKEGCSAPPPSMARRIPLAYAPEERKLNREMMEQGLIRDMMGSSTAAPIHLVPKPGHTASKPILRYCVDYRRLNKVLQQLAWPVKNIEQMLQALGDYKYYVTMGLRAGFHQIRVREEDQWLLAFVTPDGTYTFNRLPMGISIAPGHFQKELDRIFRESGCRFVLTYIDDIIFGGDSVEELAARLREVLTVLRKNKVTVKATKTLVGESVVKYLGHKVSKGCIAMDEDRIKAITSLREPRTVKELRSFLGATNYCRKFVENYGRTAATLHSLTKKNVRWAWSERHRDAFESIKRMITSAPVLGKFELGRYTVLRTDASVEGVGAVLLQGGDDDTLKPIMYISKAFDNTQRNWTTFDQEAFAIKYAMEKCRPYLIGHPFVLDTDHNNLVYMMTSKTPKIERQYLAVCEYNFTVRHISGTRNVVADFLSRHLDPEFPTNSHVPTHHAMALVARTRSAMREMMCEDQQPLQIEDGVPWADIEDDSSEESGDDLDCVKGITARPTMPSRAEDEQSDASSSDLPPSEPVDEDEGIVENSGEPTEETSAQETREEHQGELFDFSQDEDGGTPSVLQNFQPLLPAEVRKMIGRVHNAHVGHKSVKRALFLLRHNGWVWPTMEEDVKLYVASCVSCQLAKDKHGPSRQGHADTRTDEVFGTAAVDTITGLDEDDQGNTVIFVFVCCFSNFCELVPAPSKEMEHAAEALLTVAGRYGLPSALRSDKGKEYCNEIVRAVIKLMGTEEDYTVPYAPNTNGIVENRNGQVGTHLRALLVAKDVRSKWRVALPFLQRTLNSHPCEGTFVAPMTILYGTRVTPLRNLFKKPRATFDHVPAPGKRWLDKVVKLHDRIIELSKDYQNKNSEKRTTIVEGARKFNVGDIVLLDRRSRAGRVRKTQTIMMGPYRLIDFVGSPKSDKEVILLDLVTGKSFEAYTEHLRPFVSSGEQDDDMLEQLATKTKDKDYIVEEVVDHRPLERFKKRASIQPHHCEFFVHWLGYDHGTWERFSTLRDVAKLKEYLKDWSDDRQGL